MANRTPTRSSFSYRGADINGAGGGGHGYFKVLVSKAKDLKKANPDTYCRLQFNSREKYTALVMETSKPEWNTWFSFPITTPTTMFRLGVWDSSTGVDELLGEINLEMGGRHEKGSRWINLSPVPSGEVYLEWTYEYQAECDPLEYSLGQLNVEVVKAKKLPLKEFEETVSCLTVCVLGGVEYRTKIKKNTNEPYWNEIFDFEVYDSDDKCHFAILDEDTVVLARGLLDVVYNDNQKGSDWIALTQPKTKEQDPDNSPQLFIRYKYTKRKKQKDEKSGTQVDEDEIVLKSEPKMSGDVGLLPQPKRFYLWFQLLEDKKFYSDVANKILTSFFKKERSKERTTLGQWVDVAYESVDQIIEDNWKCKTRLRMFNKFRSAVESYLNGGSMIVSPEEEAQQWYRWKEHSVLRNEVAKSYKVDKALKALHNVVMYGSEDPDTETRMKVDVRMNKKSYITLCSYVYPAFVPDLSKKLAKKISGEDWERYDTKASEHGDETFLFMKLMKEWAGFWCETVTEYEYQSFLGSLVPVLMAARQEMPIKSPLIASIGKKKGKKSPKRGRTPEAAAERTTSTPPIASNPRRSADAINVRTTSLEGPLPSIHPNPLPPPDE